MSDDDRTPRYRKRAPVLGVPITPTPYRDEVTSPFDLLDRDLSAAQIEIVKRSRRNSDDPATYADIVKLAETLSRERSESRQRAADAEAVLEGPHKAHRATRRHLIAAAIAAAASIGAAVTKWGDRVAASSNDATHVQQLESGDSVRVQQLEKAIERLDRELVEIRAQLGRRSQLFNKDTAGGLPALTVTSKGIVQ